LHIESKSTDSEVSDAITTTASKIIERFNNANKLERGDITFAKTITKKLFSLPRKGLFVALEYLDYEMSCNRNSKSNRKIIREWVTRVERDASSARYGNEKLIEKWNQIYSKKVKRSSTKKKLQVVSFVGV